MSSLCMSKQQGVLELGPLLRALELIRVSNATAFFGS